MKILFSTTHPYLPLFYGGSEVSTHMLARIFLSRGHNVRVHSGMRASGGLANNALRMRSKFFGRKCPTDRIMGYPNYRTWRPEDNLRNVLRAEMPDVVMIQAGKQQKLAETSVQHGFPTVVYLRDTDFSILQAPQATLGKIFYIANSEFTAREFIRAGGPDPEVVPPLVDPSDYKTSGKGGHVLLVNPNHVKGVDVALKLAERSPDIPFIFVEGWGLPEEYEKKVRERVGKLNNLIWLSSRRDMKSVYSKTSVLLCPSGTPFEGEAVDWVEAWGRVATEAQFSGIPVIATNDGGLPESVGDGGILVERNANIVEWHNALRELWDDKEKYRMYSNRARIWSQRKEINPEILANKVLNVCTDAIDAHRSGYTQWR